MENKVLTFLQHHQIVLQEKTILVGVSGGPDSMALLHLLSQYREKWNTKLVAISIDHQLRGEESKEDIAYVEKMCNQWNIPFVSVQIDVRNYARTEKLSTQMAARELRYEVFQEQMSHYQGDYLALGHHGDDQIETLLMAVVRTSQLSSLSGIPVTRPFATGRIVRPFLAVTKQEIEQYCKKHHIQPRVDRSNLDVTYTRNFFRQFIVPKVKERHPNAHVTMQQLSESLQEDERYLKSEAEKIFNREVRLRKTCQNQKKVELSIDSFKQFPVPLQRRVYRLTLDYLYDDIPNQLTYTHEQIFLTMLNESTNKVIHFPEKLVIERSYDDLFFYFAQNEGENRPFAQQVDAVPCKIGLPNGAVLSMITSNELSAYNDDRYSFICSLDELSFPLTIRTRRPGDRMNVKGMSGTKKIKDILIDDKIPRSKRESIYLIEDNKGDILWLIGVRKSQTSEKRSEKYVLFHYEVGEQHL